MMKTKIIILALLIAGYSCKKENTNSLPQVVIGSWWIKTISVETTQKSAPQFNSQAKDTVINLVFSSDQKLQYLEVGRVYDANFKVRAIDTFYKCNSTYSISGNQLSILNLTPRFKSFFLVKDYTFLIHKSSQDTLLTIKYEETAGSIVKSYELDFDRTND